MLLHETLRDLLVADLAVEEGLATPEDVADLLASQWKERGSGGTAMRLLEALAASADLEIGDVLRLSAQADRLIAQASGSPGAALSRRHGGARSLHAALVSRVPELTKAFEAPGAAAPSALREMEAGRYTDLTPVGEGGMGTVYRAHDADLDRPVALKVVRADVAGPDVASRTLAEEVVGRFLREARLTGRLEHPGIVPVHEVGRTEAGLPYYAMRLVRNSRTLAEAIGLARGLEARLGLLEPFLKVCDTVAYAHGQGVIHRDLKPQNVALGEYGAVVVLDWGLAKALDAPEPRPRATVGEGVPPPGMGAGEGARSPSDAFLTQGGILGTVGYLAPEGLSEDARVDAPTSDVFSLGVILFEILTGRLPWPFPDLYRYAVALQQEAPDPATLEPLAPEGLAAIVRRALARAPEARFPTAADLATAVRAWQTATAASREHDARAKEAAAVLAQAESLQGEAALRQVERLNAVLGPLLAARPDHPQGLELAAAGERVRARALEQRDRAARRRTLRRTGAIALVVVAGGAVAFSTVLGQRNRDLKLATDRAVRAQGESEEAKRRAQHERDQAEEVQEYMLFSLRDALGPVGRTDLLGAIARRSVEYYDGLPAETMSPDTARRRESALSNLANVLEDQGLVAEARIRYEEAQRINDRLRIMQPGAAIHVKDRVVNEIHLAQIEAAEHRTQDALDRSQRIDREIRSQLATGRDARYWQAELADSRNRISGHLSTLRRHAEALACVREALAIWDAEDRLPDKRRDYARNRASGLSNLAFELQALGESGHAETALRESLAMYEAAVRAAPYDRPLRSSFSDVQRALAELLLERRNWAEAEELARRCLELRRQLVSIDPQNAVWRTDLAKIHATLGDVLDRMGSGEAAIAEMRAAVAVQQAQDTSRVERLDTIRELAWCHHRLAQMTAPRYHILEAVEHGREALRLLQRLPPDSRDRLGSEAGFRELAEGWASQAEAFAGMTEEERRASVAHDFTTRAAAALRSGDPAQASSYFAESWAVEEVRPQWTFATLDEAIHAGARAAASIPPGPERERRAGLAMAWLEEDLRRRALARIRESPGAAASEGSTSAPRALEGLDVRLERVRGTDPDLTVLRGRDDFEARVTRAAAVPAPPTAAEGAR